MSKDESPRNLVLPFVAGESERKKDFTYEMEVASILCLAEAERKKLGILGTSVEKVSFILKMHYPLWVIPWDNESLLVDGLDTASHGLAYQTAPDVKLFTEDLERSTVARNSFQEVLEKNAETLSGYRTVDVSIEAVIDSKQFLKVMTEYVGHDILKVQAPQPLVLAPPKLSKSSASEKAEMVIDHWRQIQYEIRGLEYAISLLSKETDFHSQKILKEIELIQDAYDSEISQVKPAVEKKVERLKVETDYKTDKVMAATEKKLSAAVRSKDKQEEKLRELERSKNNSDEKRKASKSRGDKAGESYWNSKVESYRKKISEANKKLQALSQSIEQMRKQGERTINEIREEYQALIDAEKKKIIDLEASRDQEIAKAQKERQQLQSDSSSIMNRILQILNEKRIYASKIEEMKIPLDLDMASLICVPFYLFRYDTEKKHKYRVFLPAVATDHEGIVSRIQRAIWSFSLASRIQLLLRPKSKALAVLDPAFMELMKKDKSFEENVCKLGYDNNLLRFPRLKDLLTTGMEKLQREGWVNQEEKETVLNAFAFNNQ